MPAAPASKNWKTTPVRWPISRASSISVLSELEPTPDADTPKLKLGDYKGAITDYTQAIGMSPEDGPSYSNRGFAKVKVDDFAGAVTDYNRALQVNPW